MVPHNVLFAHILLSQGVQHATRRSGVALLTSGCGPPDVLSKEIYLIS